MTIKIKLWLIGGLAMSGLLIILAINLIGTSMVNKSILFEENSFKLEIELLQARRSEKDLLLRKDTKYIDRVKQRTDRMREHLIILKQGPFKELADKAGILTDSYEKQFLVVADEIIKLGLNENSGLTGKLRKAVHDAEKAVMGNDKLYEAGILTLRRNEKDFMMRVDTKYMDRFNKNMNILISDIENSNFPSEHKQLIIDKLKLYSESMAQYSQMKLHIEDEINKFRDVVHEMEPILEKLAKESETTLHRQQTLINNTTIAAEALGAVILFVAILIIIRSILNPLFQLQKCAKDVSQRDFEACDRFSFHGELEALRVSIAEMVIQLKQSMDDAEQKSIEADRQAENANQAMKEAQTEKEYATALLSAMSTIADEAGQITLNLNTAAAQLAVQSKQIMEGAENQKHRVQETATAIDEMSATVLEVANNASSASEGSKEAAEKAKEGFAIVEQVAGATSQVQENATQLQEALTKQEQQADSIGRIMNVISDIADQTNLLALNAAIEAARAGEAGRGFAVVADEVRKLAEKTMDATHEVGTAISAIQDGTSTSLSIMNTTGKAVTECTQLAENAGLALKSIVEIVSDSASQVELIATATEQQSAAAEQINSSTMEISTISSEISEHVTESTEAAHSVNDLAAELQDLIVKMNEAREKH